MKTPKTKKPVSQSRYVLENDFVTTVHFAKDEDLSIPMSSLSQAITAFSIKERYLTLTHRVNMEVADDLRMLIKGQSTLVVIIDHDCCERRVVGTFVSSKSDACSTRVNDYLTFTLMICIESDVYV